MGLAYAVDADGDGRIDVWNDGRHLIWAVDSDNDNLLDTHLDANDDGIIDAHDDTDADGRLTAADGGRIDPPIPLQHIRMVRVWLLAASAHPVRGHSDQRTYVVGDQIITAPGDGLMRRLVETTIACRNL
jgi:type IV pilus assembly protein PilW